MKFSIDKYNVLMEDSTAMVLECYIVHEGENCKGTSFTLESIENAIPSLANKPLLVLWDYGSFDFTDHGTETNRDQLTFIGNIPESNAADIVEYDGKNFLKAKCIIWKQYHPKVVERFKNDSNAEISMEIDVSKYYNDDEGILHIDEFIFTGICLLGTDMQYSPGIQGAHISVVNFTDEQLENTIGFYNDKYCDLIDEYSVPKDLLNELNQQTQNPQKNYNILQFCKFIIDKKIVSFSTITEWYSKITKTKKSENFEYYGGEKAQDFCAHVITTHNNPTQSEELEIKIEEKEEKFSMDYEDMMQLVSEMLIDYAKDEYGMPVYRYFACGDGYVIAYKMTDDGGKFIKMPYSKEGDVPKIDFESQQEVFPKMDYLEMPDEDEKYSQNINAIVSDMYTAFTDSKKEYNAKMLEFSVITDTIDTLTIENESLKEYKKLALKAEKDEQAKDLYTKYNDIISEEDKEKFDNILYSESFEAFEYALTKHVLPLIEAKVYSALNKIEGKTKVEDDDTTDTKVIQLNHSKILPDTIDNKSTGDKLVDRLNRIINN
jgi:hypothetical protein